MQSSILPNISIVEVKERQKEEIKRDMEEINDQSGGIVSESADRTRMDDLQGRLSLAEPDLTIAAPGQSGLGAGESSNLPPSPSCKRCEVANDKFLSYRKMSEMNFRIIKEKISSTDALIKKYRKKCQENDKSHKKIGEITEKLKKCYSENGILRMELQKAKTANEPLKKIAMRFEREKKLTETLVQDLKTKLKATQSHLEEVQASIASTDQKSSNLNEHLKKMERDMATVEKRLEKKEKTIEKLASQLKEARAAKRQASNEAKKASKAVEKMKENIPKPREQMGIEEDASERGAVRRGEVTVKKASNKITKAPIASSQQERSLQYIEEQSSVASTSEDSDESESSESDSDEDDEVAAIFEKCHRNSFHPNSDALNTRDLLADFSIPSPPLSPIPPSPAPLRRGMRTGVSLSGEKDALSKFGNLNARNTGSGKINLNSVEPSKEDGVEVRSVDLMPRNGTLEKEIGNDSTHRNTSSRGSATDSLTIGDGGDEQSSNAHGVENAEEVKAEAIDEDAMERKSSLSKCDGDPGGQGANREESGVPKGDLSSQQVDKDARMVDNILGVVSSDESDSDIDGGDSCDNESDDEDYSSYDSSDPKYGLVVEQATFGSGNESENQCAPEKEVTTSKELSQKEAALSVNEGVEDLPKELAFDGCSQTIHESEEVNVDQSREDTHQADNLVSELSESDLAGKAEEKATSGILRCSEKIDEMSSKGGEKSLQNEISEESICVDGVSIPTNDNPELDASIKMHSDENSTIILLQNPSAKEASNRDIKIERLDENLIETIKEIPRGGSSVKTDSISNVVDNGGVKPFFKSTDLGIECVCTSTKAHRFECSMGKQPTEVKDKNEDPCEIASRSADLGVKGGKISCVTSSDSLNKITERDIHAGNQMHTGAADVVASTKPKEYSLNIPIKEFSMDSTAPKDCDLPCASDEQVDGGSKSFSDSSRPDFFNDKSKVRPIKTENGGRFTICREDVIKEKKTLINLTIERTTCMVGPYFTPPSDRLFPDKDEGVEKELSNGSSKNSACENAEDKCTESVKTSVKTDVHLKENSNASVRHSRSDTADIKLRNSNDNEEVSTAMQQCIAIQMKGSNRYPGIHRTQFTKRRQSSSDASSGAETLHRHLPSGPHHVPQASNWTSGQPISDKLSLSETSKPASNQEVELSLELIMAEETVRLPHLSPLPPSPRRERLRSISPLPTTPLPGLVSPILSPPELASPTSLRATRLEHDRLLVIAKPCAMSPSDSVRMLDFSPKDDYVQNRASNGIERAPIRLENRKNATRFTAVERCLPSEDPKEGMIDKEQTGVSPTVCKNKSRALSITNKRREFSRTSKEALSGSSAEKPNLSKTVTGSSAGRENVEISEPVESAVGVNSKDCDEQQIKTDAVDKALVDLPQSENEDESREPRVAAKGTSIAITNGKYSAKNDDVGCKSKGRHALVTPTRISPRKRKMIEDSKTRSLRSGEKKICVRNEKDRTSGNSFLKKGRNVDNQAFVSNPSSDAGLGEGNGKKRVLRSSAVVEKAKEGMRQAKVERSKDANTGEVSSKGKRRKIFSEEEIIPESDAIEPKENVTKSSQRIIENIVSCEKGNRSNTFSTKKDEILNKGTTAVSIRASGKETNSDIALNSAEGRGGSDSEILTKLNEGEMSSGRRSDAVIQGLEKLDHAKVTAVSGMCPVAEEGTNRLEAVPGAEVTRRLEAAEGAENGTQQLEAVEAVTDAEKGKSELEAVPDTEVTGKLEAAVGAAKGTQQLETVSGVGEGIIRLNAAADPEETGVLGDSHSVQSGEAASVNKEVKESDNSHTQSTHRLPCRDTKQTEFDYIHGCMGLLRELVSLKQVVQQLSSINNVSSATSFVSAIVNYLKANTTDNLPTLYERLNSLRENENADSSPRAFYDGIVEEFTKSPEILAVESLIVHVVEECAQMPHLNAVIRRLLHFLPKAVLSEDRVSDDNGVLSLCRLFAVICCRRNEADLFKDFLFDVACNVSLVRILDKIVLTCFCVWPKAFFNADAAAEKADEFREKVGVHSVAFSVQSLAAWLALKHANEQISKAFVTIFQWLPTSDDTLQWVCDVLLTSLGDDFFQIELEANEPGIILGPLSKDLIKSFEILLVHKGWKWCNNYLIGDRLWSIFRKWSQQQSQNNSANICSRVNDATITTAIRLIGRICSYALRDGYKSFGIIVKMCTGILTRSSQMTTISKPVQFSAAYTLLDIASIDPENVSNKLAQWIKQTNTDVPGDLQAKITSMTSKEC